MLTRGSRRAGKGLLRRKGRVSAALLAPCSVSLRQPPRGRRSGRWQRCPQAPLGGWLGETPPTAAGLSGLARGRCGGTETTSGRAFPGGGGRHGEPRRGPRPCRARPSEAERAPPRPPPEVRRRRRGADWAGPDQTRAARRRLALPGSGAVGCCKHTADAIPEPVG